MRRRYASLILLWGCDVSPLSEIFDSGLSPTDSGDGGMKIFPYDPSNFDPADAPPMGELLVRGGACTFDTANRTFDGAGCASIPSAIFGNDGAIVIAAAERMTVEADGDLLITGNRAALFAVFDSAAI